MEENNPRRPRLHKPRIIPVMDIRGGEVVRAIAGRREQYKPLVSRLTDSTDPLVVAEELRIAAQTDEIYLADLDGIVAGRPDLNLIGKLASHNSRLWVDAGIRNSNDAYRVRQAGATVVVAGLETIEDAPEVEMLAWVIGRDHFAFSVDMYAGRPIGSALSWPASPSDVINLAIKNCTEHLILLDLARVGIGSGTGTLDVCSWAKWKYPGVELIAGGGVRGPEDLPALAEAGVDAVLVASALHDGKFGLPGAAL